MRLLTESTRGVGTAWPAHRPNGALQYVKQKMVAAVTGHASAGEKTGVHSAAVQILMPKIILTMPLRVVFMVNA